MTHPAQSGKCNPEILQGHLRGPGRGEAFTRYRVSFRIPSVPRLMTAFSLVARTQDSSWPSETPLDPPVPATRYLARPDRTDGSCNTQSLDLSALHYFDSGTRRVWCCRGSGSRRRVERKEAGRLWSSRHSLPLPQTIPPSNSLGSRVIPRILEGRCHSDGSNTEKEE